MSDRVWTIGAADPAPWRQPVFEDIGRPTILVIEDDRDIQDLLETLLDLAGFTCRTCDSAEEGLEALREQQFDLVLTDYALPHRSGGWLLRQATEEGLLESTPALVVTAHPEPHDAAGFEVICKPFDLDDLVERVRRRLNLADGLRRRPIAHRKNKGAGGAGEDDGCPDPIELILYVSMHSPRSVAALENLRDILKPYADRVKLTVCNLSEDPALGVQDSVAFTPTLVKRSPGPRTFILGHITNPRMVLDLLEECEEERKAG